MSQFDRAPTTAQSSQAKGTTRPSSFFGCVPMFCHRFYMKKQAVRSQRKQEFLVSGLRNLEIALELFLISFWLAVATAAPLRRFGHHSGPSLPLPDTSSVRKIIDFTNRKMDLGGRTKAFER